MWKPTKSHIPILHPGRDLQWVERSESGNLVSGEQVPHDSRLLLIVAHNQPPCTPLTNIVDLQQYHRLLVFLKPPLYRQCVVVQAHNALSLRKQEDGSGSGAWLELFAALEDGTAEGQWRRSAHRWTRCAIGRGTLPCQLSGGHGSEGAQLSMSSGAGGPVVAERLARVVAIGRSTDSNELLAMTDSSERRTA